jgi:hydrogenase maturation factor
VSEADGGAAEPGAGGRAGETEHSRGLPLGKLPPELLARLLGRLPVSDPRVLVPPRPGVDAAALDFGERALIVTADPITFVSERAGWYAVNVNANDIAVMGGVPRWFLATILLPEGITPDAVEALFSDVTGACAGLGVTVIGGHTEVTHGLDRPIIAGTMLGEAPPNRVLTSGGVRPGDALLVTGGIAIEGTAILAVEARAGLLAAGLDTAMLERAARLAHEPGVSVVGAARTLLDAAEIHALHDATEGGLATALLEMAQASGVRIELAADALPVLPETAAVCAALGLDPLGLLASGCLVAAVPAESADAALAALTGEGIAAWRLGVAAPGAPSVWLLRGGERAPLPEFARDELARWLAEAAPSLAARERGA